MTHSTYGAFADDRKRHRENNDCVPIAISVVTGMSYDEAIQAMAAVGRQKGKGLAQYVYYQWLKDHGYTIRRITGEFEGKTVRTVERELAANWGNAKILINVRRHVLAWDGRQIVDWTAGRLQRVIDICLVYKDEPPKTKAVPVPERHELRGRKGHKRSAVLLTCRELGIDKKEYRSVKAAYDDNGFDLRGHQKARRYIKRFGSLDYQVCTTGSLSWNVYDIRIELADPSSAEINQSD